MGFEEFPYLIRISMGSRRFVLGVWKPTTGTSLGFAVTVQIKGGAGGV